MIDFFTNARTRILSGRLLVGRAIGLTIGRGVASVLSAGWVILIARRLTLNEFGEVTVALSLIIILTSLSDLGLQFMLAKDVVETGRIRRPVLDSVIARRLVLAVVSALVMVVLYELATHDRNLLIPLLFTLSIFGGALYNPTITGYRATGNIRLEIISEVGSRAVVLAGGGLWVLAGGGVIAVAAAFSSVGLATGLIDYFYLRGKSSGEVTSGSTTTSLRCFAMPRPRAYTGPPTGSRT